MVRYLFVALCLVGCTASNPPREYQRGVYVSPPPAPQPGVGAPVIGQPGYVGPAENIPRSPYTRVLPQTKETRREDTIWAATSSEESPAPRILGAPVPIPADWTIGEKEIADVCAKTMDKAAQQKHKELQVPVLFTKEHACVGAHLFKVCADNLAPGTPMYERLRNKDSEAVKRVRKAAQQHTTNLCDGVKFSPEINKFVWETVSLWRNTIG